MSQNAWCCDIIKSKAAISSQVWTALNKKGQHRSCHTAKCNMLNKWLKKKLPLVTHTFTFITIHLKHDLFTHICTNISHTRTTTYAHMHICNPPLKVTKLSAATWRILSISCRTILFLFRLRSTIAATWRISCNTYADALNSTEFCIMRLIVRHFVRYLGICNPICVKLVQLMSGVITQNSVKNEVSILINGWVTANYSVSRPPFCQPSWNL